MYTDIYLLNAYELDVYHNHTFSFASREQQINYFIGKKVKTIENVNYHRKNNNLKVNYHIDELQFVNYVMINNEKPLNKWYYYFVIDRKYINENCTELILKLDVIQTYLFDYTFKSSLVERQHYDRYTSDGKVVTAYFNQDYNINTGEYLNVSNETFYKYDVNGTYIVTTTDPLGKGANENLQGGKEYPGTELFGDVSANLYRFIKGYEAFGKVPYTDSTGNLTVGYGVTKLYFPDEYNDLVINNTEENASLHLYRIIKNEFYDKIITEIKNCRNNPRQNEIDAFTSLAYNCGVNGCINSPMYQNYIKNKSSADCVKDWYSYLVHDIEGLKNRRSAEASIFTSADYTMKPIEIVGGGTVTANNGNGYIPYNLKWILGNEYGGYESVVDSARKLIGKPYRYGGNYPPLGDSDGTDCSGLCEWAYQDVGISTGLSHRWTTYTMYAFTRIINSNEAQAGDVVYSGFSGGQPSHVRIVVKVEGNVLYWVGAENEDIGIIESTSSIGGSNFVFGTFRG